MQFEVQGQNYFLTFHSEDGRWYLLKPTHDGFTGMAVLDDSAPSTAVPVLIPDEQEEEPKLVN